MTALIVGVAGGSGSGKTTVARRVAADVQGASTALLDLDAYYRDLPHLTFEQRRHVNWDHPDALELDLFLEHLHALAARRAIDKPMYDYVAHLRAPHPHRVEPADVVVVDGVLLFADPRVRALCDVKVFVDTEPDVRLARRIRRDLRARGRPLEEILEQYLTTVRPMHLEFVEPTKQHADVIVTDGGRNDAAIDRVIARIHDRLAARRP